MIKKLKHKIYVFEDGSMEVVSYGNKKKGHNHTG
jgi:hypothetical protein